MDDLDLLALAIACWGVTSVLFLADALGCF